MSLKKTIQQKIIITASIITLAYNFTAPANAETTTDSISKITITSNPETIFPGSSLAIKIIPPTGVTPPITLDYSIEKVGDPQNPLISDHDTLLNINNPYFIKLFYLYQNFPTGQYVLKTTVKPITNSQRNSGEVVENQFSVIDKPINYHNLTKPTKSRQNNHPQLILLLCISSLALTSLIVFKFYQSTKQNKP